MAAKKSPAPDPPSVTAGEAAKMMGIDKSHVYRLIRTKELAVAVDTSRPLVSAIEKWKLAKSQPTKKRDGKHSRIKAKAKRRKSMMSKRG